MLAGLLVATIVLAIVVGLAWLSAEDIQAEGESWMPTVGILGVLIADGIAIGWWVMEVWR
jgi:hypothetical protein